MILEFVRKKINGTLVEKGLITDKISSHPQFSKLLLGRVPRQQVGFQILEGRFLPLVQFLRVAPPRVSIVVRYDLVLASRSLRLDRLRAGEKENFREIRKVARCF